MILLHGFPDSGRLWRNQVPALAGAGFRVIVPDLRGYGRSDKPEAADFVLLSLAGGDVMAVLSDAGVERAHVVGHDWGAALAMGDCASLAPDRVDHLAVLSVGHPATFRRTPGTAREVLVHALVPVRRRRRAVADRTTTGPTSARGPATPTPTRSSPSSRPTGR